MNFSAKTRSKNIAKLDSQEFDLVISNPPYIKSKEIDDLQVEVRKYEPKLALDGGFDGLDCYRDIAKNVCSFLKIGGYLVLEIGQNQENDVRDIFEKVGLNFIEQRKDLSSIIRCLIFRK